MIRPMLAASKEDFLLKNLPFPLIVSAKIDGIRALISNGRVFSRSGKLIPNRFIQRAFGNPLLEGLDGELVVGSPSSPRTMQETVSGVMAYESTPDVHFFAFDDFILDLPYKRRFEEIGAFFSQIKERNARLNQSQPSCLHLVPFKTCNSLRELCSFEEQIISEGFEGLILRTPHGKYKHGRSTFREFNSSFGGMLKLKRIASSEARVVGFLPAMANLNEAKIGAFGLIERSSALEGKEPKAMLGSFQCTSPLWEEPFKVAPGILTQAEREHIWQQRENFLGQTLSFKHFQVTGVKDKPRFPRFNAWRPAEA